MVKIRQQPSHPWVIAHRGARGGHARFSPQLQLLENGADALKRADSLAVDGIEVDLRLSGDNVVMLCHDHHLQRLTGIDDVIENVDAAILQQAGLLRLDRALQLCPRQPLFLEWKDQSSDPLERRRLLVERTLAVVATAPVQPMLLSFSDTLLQWAGEFDSSLLRGRNMDQAELHPYDYLSCNIHGLHADFVAAAHAAGQPVITWNVCTKVELKHALSCGVDGIITDHPAWLQHQLATR